MVWTCVISTFARQHERTATYLGKPTNIYNIYHVYFIHAKYYVLKHIAWCDARPTKRAKMQHSETFRNAAIRLNMLSLKQQHNNINIFKRGISTWESVFNEICRCEITVRRSTVLTLQNTMIRLFKARKNDYTAIIMQDIIFPISNS